jgi:GNAT superfamily N-acetyltransferase
VLTSDPGRVDVDQVHAWLSQESYWALGRERAVVERSIAGSRPYCVYTDGSAGTDDPRSIAGLAGAAKPASADDSLCSNDSEDSVLTTSRQVAYARVVTDGATFAWIGDVFVDADHRGRGLGSWLVTSIVANLQEAGVRRFVLATRDAHEVYRRCGFKALEGADRWMEIDERPTHPAAGS